MSFSSPSTRELGTIALSVSGSIQDLAASQQLNIKTQEDGLAALEEFFFKRFGEDVELSGGSLVTRRGYRILQELVGSSEDFERQLEEFCHPVISPGGNSLLCSAGLPSLEQDFHLLHCTSTTFIRPGHTDTVTVNLLTASLKEVGESFHLQQFDKTEQCQFVTVTQSLSANLRLDIEVRNMTEGVICLEKGRNIGAATTTSCETVPEPDSALCTRAETSDQIGANNLDFCEAGAGNNCQTEAVSFGNVKETKDPGKSTFSDGETDGESSARIYPSKLKDKKENVGKYFSLTCWGEQTVPTQPFSSKQAKNTSINSEPARVENISPPTPADDSCFSMGSINFQPVGPEETPSDLSDVDNTDQNNEVSGNFPEFPDNSVETSFDQERISPKSNCMGTIALESVDAYDETLDSDYEEPEDDKSKSPDRCESKKGELWGRNKYKVHYKLYHGGKKVSVKLRKCSVSLPRLSRKQSNTGKRLKRREVWISGGAGASRSVKTYKWKTNDLSLSGSSREPRGSVEIKRNQSVPVVEGESSSASQQDQGRVRTLLDPLKPLLPQIKRLHLLLPDRQPGLTELGLVFPAVVSAPQLAHIIAAFLRFYQVSLHQLQEDQNKTR